MNFKLKKKKIILPITSKLSFSFNLPYVCILAVCLKLLLETVHKLKEF